jgi:CRISPR-associated protein Csa3
MGTVLISTFYSFEPLVAAATRYSPSKIILLVSSSALSGKDKEKVKASIDRAKEVYGKVISLTVKTVEEGDLLGIASMTVELLKNEEGTKIINVSGGWKTLMQGVLYGCYARPELVEKIVCNDLSKDGALLELPKLSFSLSATKKEVLQSIAERKGKSIPEIADSLKISRGMLYQHLKELKENGYVDDKFYITDAGRMALL